MRRPAPPPIHSILPLLGLAARRMMLKGLDFRSRLKVLRGLYYGAQHSLDYEKRRSRLRNLGFNLYLRTSAPPDPAPLIGADLARMLKTNPEVQVGNRALDLGHVLVGLEARSKVLVRRFAFLAQGGTGLELATWVGDLGGAAGLLAVGRMDDPDTRAVELLFSPRTYDLRANLEGALAAYLVARDPTRPDAPSEPRTGPASTLEQALQNYLRGPGSDWSQRYRLFAAMIGGRPDPRGLSNPLELRQKVFRKTLAFTSLYTVYRLRALGRLDRANLNQAARHVHGAAAELSTLFVNLLDRGIRCRHGEFPRLDDPPPSPAGEPDPKTLLLGWTGFMAPKRVPPFPRP